MSQTHSQSQAHSHCDVTPVLRKKDPGTAGRAPSPNIIIIIIIIIKRGWQCKAGRERLTPYQSKDPIPTTPTHRKKEEKGKNSRRQKGSEQLGQ